MSATEHASSLAYQARAGVVVVLVVLVLLLLVVLVLVVVVMVVVVFASLNERCCIYFLIPYA
jgi:hypothetical protein